MHRGSPGYDEIDSGEYVLSDEEFGGALIPPDKWDQSFGQGGTLHSVSYSSFRG